MIDPLTQREGNVKNCEIEDLHHVMQSHWIEDAYYVELDCSHCEEGLVVRIQISEMAGIFRIDIGKSKEEIISRLEEERSI